MLCVECAVLQSLLDELGGMDYENSCDVPVAPSSAVAGVSPVREGTVIYPKNRDRSNTRYSEYQLMVTLHFCTH